MQNGFMESCSGRMQDEPLNEVLFFGFDHARQAVAEWAEDYTIRPGGILLSTTRHRQPSLPT